LYAGVERVDSGFLKNNRRLFRIGNMPK